MDEDYFCMMAKAERLEQEKYALEWESEELRKVLKELVEAAKRNDKEEVFSKLAKYARIRI